MFQRIITYRFPYPKNNVLLKCFLVASQIQSQFHHNGCTKTRAMKKILTTWTLLLLAVVGLTQVSIKNKNNPFSEPSPVVGNPPRSARIDVPLEYSRNEYDEHYRQGYNQLENRRNNQKQIIFSYLPYLLCAGFILFLILISNNASKSTKQKVKEVELPDIKTATVNDDMIGKIERLGKLKEQGLISEEEFQTLKQKILQ